jgi:hypothetical protein
MNPFLGNGGVRRPRLQVLPYRHDKNFKYVVDLRAFGKGRRFFREKAEAEAFAQTQKDALARHGKEALGLSRRELSEIIQAKQRLAAAGATITDAVKFFLAQFKRVKSSS